MRTVRPVHKRPKSDLAIVLRDYETDDVIGYVDLREALGSLRCSVEINRERSGSGTEVLRVRSYYTGRPLMDIDTSMLGDFVWEAL